MGLQVTFFFFLLLLLSSTASSLSNQCHKKDVATLLQIKKLFAGSPSVAGWGDTPYCCNWLNVGCDDFTAARPRIQHLSLFDSNYTGPVPSVFGRLRDLTVLYFQDMPNLSGPVPPFLRKLKSLGTLMMRNNALSGHVPSFLCSLPQLSDIDLSTNRLTGHIPGCFGSRFTNLNFARNQLSGAIPASLFRSTNGTSSVGPNLDLSDNDLVGRIPRQFKDVLFQTINLSGNRLTGDAYPLFWPRQATRDIRLSGNRLAFDLSRATFSASLGAFNVSHNRIQGRIPEQIAEVNGWAEFDVSYNRLCGPIPSGGSLSQLPPSAFEHNKCLCGAPLPPCK